MKKYVDLLFQSMTERDYTMLPLTDTYIATENSQGASLPIMSFWRTVTGLNFIGQIIQDKEQGQVFVTANLNENGMPSVFFGRLKIENEKISELELYIDRSRADSGFVLLPDEMNKHPRGWTSPNNRRRQSYPQKNWRKSVTPFSTTATVSSMRLIQTAF